ncbi:MAG: glucosaminidase domain-containing protein [Verrucomicrobium sp.]|nr:glucosaminidase domain-containing protein [Verrucomicrobium sp.]
MQSIDLTDVIARRPFYKAKPRKVGLWTTLLVSNAFWCAFSALLLVAIFSLTRVGQIALEKFVEQRSKMAEMETAKAQAIAERDAKIANLLRFQSSSTSDILTMARALNLVFTSASNANQEHFFEAALPEALRLQITEGIPASAIMAQAILESSYGQSKLAKNYHNYFGIKAFNNWKGPRAQNMATLDDGVIPTIADFRAYPTLSEGFNGYVAFLKASGRYDDAFRKKTGIEFIRAVFKDGYTGDVRYLDMVHDIIVRHHLEKLDEIYAAQLAKGDASLLSRLSDNS